MATVYPDYPHGLSDKKLVAAIQEYATTINTSRANINTVLQFSPYISLGLNELQSRQNKRTTYVSFGVGLVSLIVAGVALHISIDSSRSGDLSSARQIALLEEVNNHLLANTIAVTEAIKSQKVTPQKQPDTTVVKSNTHKKAARPLP